MKRVMLLMFAMALVFTVANIASAQPDVVTDFNTVTLTIDQTLLVTGGVDVPFSVSPGVCYSIKTDGHAIPILADGTDIVDPLLWTVDGQSGGAVTITFTLPTVFFSAANGNSFPITFGTADGLWDNTGAGDGVTGTAFNPNVPYSDFMIGGGGGVQANVYLGYNFCVPANAPAGSDYLATFALTASTTGF